MITENFRIIFVPMNAWIGQTRTSRLGAGAEYRADNISTRTDPHIFGRLKTQGSKYVGRQKQRPLCLKPQYEKTDATTHILVEET